MKYSQCKLVAENLTQIAWIPNKFAVRNKRISIKGDEKIWTVLDVFSTQEHEDINDSHDSKNIWKATSGNFPRGNK